MNILLWVLQALLAVHTLTGAVWKLANPSQTVPSLAAIPHGAWLGMSVVEVLCGLCLVLPAWRKVPALLAPVAAACIGAEMLLMSAVHLASGSSAHAELTYWLVVAVLCAFIVYGRLVLRPLRRSEQPLT